MSNENSDLQLAEVTRLVTILGGENASKDKKKALQDLTRLAALATHQSALSQVFDKLLVVLKPLLGDRTLRAQAIACLGQVGNSSVSCFDALVKWQLAVLVQSKQADKRALRLSQLSDFAIASIKCWPTSPSSKHHEMPFLHAHAPSILTHSWNLLDLKSLDSLASPLLAITSTLATHVPSALISLSSHLVRAFILWGSQEVSDDVTERFSNCAALLAPLLRLATPSFLETATKMLQEFASVPLVPPMPSKKGTGAVSAGDANFASSAASPSSSNPSATSDATSSATVVGGALSTAASTQDAEWRAPQISPGIASAVSLIRSLVEGIGSSVWRDSKLVFSLAVSLFATAREVHRTNHTFSHRYQWDVACTQLLASLSELNTSPRVPWDPRTLSLYSFWFAEHLTTFPAMRVSKLFTLLNAHIRFLSNYACSQPALPSNMTPFWATEVLALRSIGRNRELAVLVHRMHSLIIAQWPLDFDTCDWIPSTILSHLKHETGADDNDAAKSKPDQSLETLALLDVHLLTSLYKRFSQSPPFTSYFSEAKTQRLAIEAGRNGLKRTLEVFELSKLTKQSPALQAAIVQLLSSLVILGDISLCETLSSKQDTTNIEWERLLDSNLQSDTLKAALQLVRSLASAPIASTSSNGSTAEVTKIDPTKAQKLVYAVLDALMEADPSVRLDAANTMLSISTLNSKHSTGSKRSLLLDEESCLAIYDQLVLFGSLADSSEPVRVILTRLLVQIGRKGLHQLGRSNRAERFFPNWSGLVPLALDALHPLSLGSFSEQGTTLSYFGKSEFASVLALTTEAGLSQSAFDQALTSILDITRVGTKLSVPWVDNLPALTRSSAFSDGNEKSAVDEPSAHSASFELAFSAFVTQRLVRYSTAAKEHWATWEACIFAILTKLKPSFANAKEFLSFLESNLMLKDADTHNGADMMIAARRRLSWLEKFEKTVSAASPGLLALPTLSSHPAAQFFKNNYHVCADWFVGVRKQTLRFSLKYGTSSDVLRHAFVRLSHLLQQATQSGPNFFPETPEYYALILSITEGLIEKADADSLLALHSFVSARPLANPQASVNAKRLHVSLLEVIRAALLQSSSNFEAALQVYRSIPAAEPTADLTAMVTENTNRCIMALGSWKEVSSVTSPVDAPPEAAVSFNLRSISSKSFASLLKSIADPMASWTAQRLTEVQGSQHKILQQFSLEPPHNSQSFGAFIDAALYEAAVAVKAYPTADRGAMKKALENLEVMASPFVSSASSNRSTHDLNFLVEKLQVLRVVTDSLAHVDNPSFGAQNLKSLSLPSLTHLLTLSGLIYGQEDELLVVKIMKKAQKTGNRALAIQMCERLPVGSVDALLTRATLLAQQGKHAEGLQLLWSASSPALQSVATIALGTNQSSAASSLPASASTLANARIESVDEMRIGLTVCNMLGEGRRDPAVLAFVSSLASLSAAPSTVSSPSQASPQAPSQASVSVDSLREKMLESLRLPSDLHARDNSDLECHLSYADAIYSRGTALTKKAESDPLSVVPPVLKERLLQICGSNSEICDSVLKVFVPQCLTMLMDEQRANHGASVLSKELEQRGISGLDFAVSQLASDLVLHLLAPYNRALQTYSRWLYLSASGAMNENFFDRTLRAALRLLRLLTKYGEALLMVSECLDAVPVGVWTHLTPQLISRLGHSHSFVRNHVLKLLIKVATSHPQAIIYQSLVRSGGANEESSKPSSTTPAATGRSISAQIRAKPLPTTSKLGNTKSAASASHYTATRLQREQLTKLKYSLMHLHPRLVSDTQLLLAEIDRITFLPDEKALSVVSELLREVEKRQQSIQEESARLKVLYPQIETRTNMLKEKHQVIMRPTVAKLELFARDIASLLTPAASASVSTSASASASPSLASSASATPYTPSTASPSTPAKSETTPESGEPDAVSATGPSKFESLFATNVLPVLSKVIGYLRDEPHLAADGQGHITVLSLTHAVELLQQLHSRLHKSIRRKSFHMSSVAPRLSALSGSTIPVPGVAPDTAASSIGEETVTIQSVDDLVVILVSLTRPKKMRLLGSNGQTYTYLIKSKEDLQLDERIMQILSTVNRLLRRDKETRKRGEEARHYSVIPTSARSGIIQWVHGTTPLYQLFLDHMMRVHAQQNQAPQQPQANSAKKPAALDASAPAQPVNRFVKPTEAFIYKMQLRLSEIGLAPVPRPGAAASLSSLPPSSQWPKKVVLQVYEELTRETPSDVFWKAMWSWSGDVESHARTVQRYNRSTATSSIIGYVLGLGDRHLDNILLDASTGDVIHIDYNVCFEAGLQLYVPEVVPFRLSPNIVNALGVLGLQGTFQISAQHVLRVLSQARETLLTMLEAFVYDPLVDWGDNGQHHEAASTKPAAARPATSAVSRTDPSSSTKPEVAAGMANKIPQLRVVLSLFAQRLALHSPYLINTQQVTALRTNIAHMYSHAHLLLHSKTEHAKVHSVANERAAQFKALEESHANVLATMSSLKKAIDKSKSKLSSYTSSEKDAEDALRNAVVGAQSVFLQTTANSLQQLFRPDLGQTGDARDLYSLVVGPLPWFLQLSSLPKPLAAFSSTQQWPHLPIVTLSRSKEVSAKLDAALDSFDNTLGRASRLLTTYRAIALQLPEGYTSFSELEGWLNSLESVIATPSAPARDSLRHRLAQCFEGSFESFLNYFKSKSATKVTLSAQDRDDFDRANQLLVSLQAESERLTAEMNPNKAKVVETERRLTNTRVVLAERVSKVADLIAAPPGLSTLNVPEMALLRAAAVAITGIKQEFESLETSEAAKMNAVVQPINPFLSFLAPVPTPVASPTPSSSQKHTVAESLSASLQRAYVVIGKRLKTITVLCPSLLPPLVAVDPAAAPVSIADRFEQVILILQSLTGSLSEICSNLNSLTHMDANQAILEFVNSAEYNGGVEALRNFFSTQLAPSHPLVTLDRFLALTYARFVDLHQAVSGDSALPTLAANFFEAEHAKLFANLTTSPSPSTLLVEYFSDLLYKVILQLTFDAIASRILVSSFDAVVPSLGSLAAQMESELADCITSSDVCARLAWQQALEAMAQEKLEAQLSDCNNGLVRMQWLIDQYEMRNGVTSTGQPSFRRQLLSTIEQAASELSTSLATIDSLAPQYAHAEDAIAKLMDTQLAHAKAEEAKVASRSSADPSNAASLISGSPAASQLESARQTFANSSELRRETLTVIQNVARESLTALSSVLRFERDVRGARVELSTCGEEAAKYLVAANGDPKAFEHLVSLEAQMDSHAAEADDLADKLIVLTAQMDIDKLLYLNFDKEVGVAREQVLPATIATRKALVVNEEANVEKDLDLLFTSIAHRSSFAETESDSIETEIHNTAAQLEKVTAYLRTEIRCLTAPLSHFLLNPSDTPMQIPARDGSNTTVPFNARATDLPAGQKRLLDALKLRKRLLLDLDKVAKRWLSLHPDDDASATSALIARSDEEVASQEIAANELRSSQPLANEDAANNDVDAVPALKDPNVIDLAVAFPSAFAGAPAATSAAPTALVNSKTINILKRIQQKLDNTDPLLFKSLPAAALSAARDPVSAAASYAQPLPRRSINDQVSALISEATDPANLSVMYLGWAPWI